MWLTPVSNSSSQTFFVIWFFLYELESCILCPSIYSFWLPLCSLQAFLPNVLKSYLQLTRFFSSSKLENYHDKYPRIWSEGQIALLILTLDFKHCYLSYSETLTHREKIKSRKNGRPNATQDTNDWATLTPSKTGRKLMFSEKLSRFWSTNVTLHVTLVDIF
jgi:hypothetical protein